ncbi:MAG: hypothetical protein AAGH92_10430 [Planctomycetota bacterium]
MPWFQKLCRQTGLAIHGVMHPSTTGQSAEVHRTVEEQQVSDTVTLRRTTIEEIEIKPEGNSDHVA